MESMSWFKNLARYNPPRAQESEKAAAYSHLLQTSDESSISDEENPLTEEDSQSTKRRTINRFLILFIKTLLIFLALWGLITLGRTSVNKLRLPKPTSCSCGGTTVAEAISRGCIFTPLALAWLPPHCLDLELSNEFDALKPWPYYADRNGTIPITREEMGLLADVDGVFYTTQEWHIMHCMFTWRKHYRSKTTGVVIENRSNGIKHIHHCEGIVLDRVPLEGVWTVAGVELNADLG